MLSIYFLQATLPSDQILTISDAVLLGPTDVVCDLNVLLFTMKQHVNTRRQHMLLFSFISTIPGNSAPCDFGRIWLPLRLSADWTTV